jgi:hypothetical protein
MTEHRDFRDDVAETLELVRDIHDRVVDGPLFPLIEWQDRPGPLWPGGSKFTHQIPFAAAPSWCTIDMRAVDENRIEIRFWLDGAPSRPFVFAYLPRS